ncbi:MAG TPA: dirigent protein [Anaerolineales bacterium]
MRTLKFLMLSVALIAAPVSARGLTSPLLSRDKPHVLTVVEHAVSDTVVDTGATGDSLGDILAFGNPIFNAANSKEIGRDEGYCMRTNVGLAWECNWTVILDQGSLTVEGPFYDDLHDSQLAITGGTGAFRDASGEMTLHARDAAGTAFDFIYRFAH